MLHVRACLLKLRVDTELQQKPVAQVIHCFILLKVISTKQVVTELGHQRLRYRAQQAALGDQVVYQVTPAKRNSVAAAGGIDYQRVTVDLKVTITQRLVDVVAAEPKPPVHPVPVAVGEIDKLRLQQPA